MTGLRNSIRIFAILVFLVVVCGAYNPGNVSAAPISLPVHTQDNTSTDCYSLDLIFVIDQSSSMGGDESAPGNDPTGQRAYGPRWAIDWLTDNALDICPDAFHRAAVVSFGGEVSVDLPFSDINPNNTDEWSFLRKKLKGSITPQDLGQTDPRLAFEEAVNILNNAAPIEGVKRKRVIIYMTDGMPCVAELGCVKPVSTMDFVSYAKSLEAYVNTSLPFDSTLLKQNQCISELRQVYGDEKIPAEKVSSCMEANRVTPAAYENSTYIWTMLISYGSAWPQSLRSVYESMSTSHGGQVIDITQKRKDIPATFLDIMTDLAGVPVTRLGCGNFAVNPFVRQARMTFFKIDEETKVKISYVDAANNSHEVTNGEHSGGFTVKEHYSEGANERYVFDYPYPGIWRLESDSCEGIDAYYEPIQLDLSTALKPVTIWNGKDYTSPETTTLPQYELSPYYNIDKSFYLAVEVRDTGGNVVSNVELPALGAQVMATVTQPDGKKESYPMLWVDADKKFRTENRLMLPAAGTYQVSVKGTSPHKDLPYGPVNGQDLQKVFNQQLDLFLHEGIRFDVFEVTPLTVEILDPLPNQVLQPIHFDLMSGNWKWPLIVSLISMRMRIAHEDGTPVTNAQILTDTGSVTASLRPGMDPDTAAVVQIPLLQNPNVPGEYSGQFDDYTAEGLQTLKVGLSGDYDDHYRFVMKEDSISFSRMDEWMNRADVYQRALGVLIALILLRILLFILDRTNPVSGKLVFPALGTEAEEFALRGKNKVQMGGSKFSGKEFLDLWLLQAESLPRPKKTKKKIVTEDGVMEDPGDGDEFVERKIKVKMCLVSEGKGVKPLLYWLFPIFIHWDREYTLTEGASQDYSDKSLAPVEYRSS